MQSLASIQPRSSPIISRLLALENFNLNFEIANRLFATQSVISASASGFCADYARDKAMEHEQSSADPHDPLCPSLFRRQDHPGNARLADEFSEKRRTAIESIIFNLCTTRAELPPPRGPGRKTTLSARSTQHDKNIGWRRRYITVSPRGRKLEWGFRLYRPRLQFSEASYESARRNP